MARQPGVPDLVVALVGRKFCSGGGDRRIHRNRLQNRQGNQGKEGRIVTKNREEQQNRPQ
jgi:hypothetical protein